MQNYDCVDAASFKTLLFVDGKKESAIRSVARNSGRARSSQRAHSGSQHRDLRSFIIHLFSAFKIVVTKSSS